MQFQTYSFDFSFLFSLFAYYLNIANKHLENHNLRDESSIGVECYEIDTDFIVHDNIDQVFHSNGIFRLDAFSHTVGDFLFDVFQVLLHFRYSSTDMPNGLIDYFLGFLENGDVEALESYQYELASDFLCQLHGIHDVTTHF
jgi:hypothetical protein